MRDPERETLGLEVGCSERLRDVEGLREVLGLVERGNVALQLRVWVRERLQERVGVREGVWDGEWLAVTDAVVRLGEHVGVAVTAALAEGVGDGAGVADRLRVGDGLRGDGVEVRVTERLRTAVCVAVPVPETLRERVPEAEDVTVGTAVLEGVRVEMEDGEGDRLRLGLRERVLKV